MSWLKEVIGTEKAIIAMCHIKPMPGDPYYDRELGMDYVYECARKELLALQEGGVDAVLFSNEFSFPYLTDVGCETVASMARVIGQMHGEIKVPFGVNVLWDAEKSLDLAAAVGAKFVREIFTGVYASDFGLWNTNCGATVRKRQAIGAQDVKLLFNIVPESAAYLAARDITQIAKTTVFNCRPDALCISGITAGSDTDPHTLRSVKEAVGDVVVLANTGVRMETMETQLQIADGAVVGTCLKRDGVFTNPVDAERVKRFMEKANAIRSRM